MKIYIAGHNQEEGRRLAEILKRCGHTITSTWLNESLAEENGSDDENKRLIAEKDAKEIFSSDAVVLFASPRRVPGGKFVECGIAIGAGLPVYLLGHRENMLMYHGLVQQFNSIEDFLAGAK